MSSSVDVCTLAQPASTESLEMAELCIAAFLVGALAAFVMRVLPFALLIFATAVLRLGVAFAYGRLSGFVVLATIFCVAVAQTGFVIGIVAHAIIMSGSPEERRHKLTTSLRRLMVQRK